MPLLRGGGDIIELGLLDEGSAGEVEVEDCMRFAASPAEGCKCDGVDAFPFMRWFDEDDDGLGPSSGALHEPRREDTIDGGAVLGLGLGVAPFLGEVG